MGTLSFTQLKSPYDSFLKEGRWDEYIASICEEGLTLDCLYEIGKELFIVFTG
jgi:hypothetical protein